MLSLSNSTQNKKILTFFWPIFGVNSNFFLTFSACFGKNSNYSFTKSLGHSQELLGGLSAWPSYDKSILTIWMIYRPCRTKLDDKSHLLFVYTVTASTSKSCWILIIDIVKQPKTGFNSKSGSLKEKSKKQTFFWPV